MLELTSEEQTIYSGTLDPLPYLKFLCPRNGEMMEAVNKRELSEPKWTTETGLVLAVSSVEGRKPGDKKNGYFQGAVIHPEDWDFRNYGEHIYRAITYLAKLETGNHLKARYKEIKGWP
ncbi:hypothetical protein [Roseibium sp. RKSG952]|uniref:hypothetical protein n=1 Tax=Roseibium sp. RKSG952 TaxID=2529384 RepID=UPI0012BC40DC|nr:hypothetical protein [Roseibium sp. RKSG952]MTH94984.1 hypothetical protein [Roseibium sp. RKSG952]